jgi:myosin-crossreactive antigen
MRAIPDNAWYKSSRSAGANNCVEVAHEHGSTTVRDSKNKTGPVLTFTDREWRTFIESVASRSGR